MPGIYTELLKQTQIVMAEELNPAKKMLRLRARPKILFCSTYDEAWEIYEKYKTNLLDPSWQALTNILGFAAEDLFELSDKSFSHVENRRWLSSWVSAFCPPV